jgi:hypothetical protein
MSWVRNIHDRAVARKEREHNAVERHEHELDELSAGAAHLWTQIIDCLEYDIAEFNRLMPNSHHVALVPRQESARIERATEPAIEINVRIERNNHICILSEGIVRISPVVTRVGKAENRFHVRRTPDGDARLLIARAAELEPIDPVEVSECILEPFLRPELEAAAEAKAKAA